MFPFSMPDHQDRPTRSTGARLRGAASGGLAGRLVAHPANADAASSLRSADQVLTTRLLTNRLLTKQWLARQAALLHHQLAAAEPDHLVERQSPKVARPADV